MRNLILTEDYALMQRLLKYAREALSDHSDQQLAVMIAAKRLDDYKQALARRNIWSVDSPGTYGWIIQQNRKTSRRSAVCRASRSFRRARHSGPCHRIQS